MTSKPTGTVTFLFTDIENSTQLAREHPEAWETAQARHHTILRAAIEQANGFVFQVIGDAFCAAFHKPGDALKSAWYAQQNLQKDTWGEAIIRVRMGIHTGEAEIEGNEYRGYLTLSLVQRLMSAGHGGQILVSNATENLLRDQLPQELSLRDIGVHKFTGVPYPVRVFQVIAPDLRQEFPPLRTPDILPNNLPTQLTSFIGREKELADVKRLLPETHLLTLIGPGGTGKTRLSIRAANELLDQYPDGVWFVELAPILDPLLVPRTSAIAIGLRDEPQRPVIDMLCDYLREKKILIVLDNCEHLIDACARLADRILHAAPKVRILASSREGLGIAGEVTYRVPSLGLPDIHHLPPIESLTQYEAVKLFIDRATNAVPSFVVMNHNAPALAQVCHRLDGIPLAIELAAAKIRVLSVEQIAKRLDDRLRLLTGGGHTTLERHQTLRAAIDWSYNLLSSAEQILFSRLSVFVGGWTLEAAESVCSDEPVKSEDVLDLLEQLINKSLVIKEEAGHESRYHMLETIRQYANEKLGESGEDSVYHDKHLTFFSQWIENHASKNRYTHPQIWMSQIDLDHDNLRAALKWALTHHIEMGIQLFSQLQEFWLRRGFWTESIEWSESFLTKPEVGALHTPYLVSAFTNAGYLAMFLRNSAEAQTWFEKSLVLGKEINDESGLAGAYLGMGRLATIFRVGIKTPQEWFEDSLALARSIDDKPLIAHALVLLGEIFYDKDIEKARIYFEESLDVARKEDLKQMMFWPLGGLGSLFLSRGNLIRSRELFEESLTYLRLGNRKDGSLIWCLTNLTEIFLRLGNFEAARSYLIEAKHVSYDINSTLWETYLLTEAIFLIWATREYDQALHMCQEFYESAKSKNDVYLIAPLLWTLVEWCFGTGYFELGVVLIGNMESAEFNFGKPMHPLYRADIERNLAIASQKLTQSRIQSLLSEGNSMKLDDAFVYALKGAEEINESKLPSNTDMENRITPALLLSQREVGKQKYGGLTERERQVAAQIAQGKSNQAIAAELFVGLKTVEAHVTRILSKLGFTSRAQIAAWAVAKGLTEAPQDLDTLGREG